MPNTRINKQNWRNHFQYAKWVYVLLAIVIFFGCDMIYTMTEYRPPNERKVDFEIVGSYADTETLQTISDGLLEQGQAFDPTLEEIGMYAIAYSGDAETDIYGAQKYMVMIAAQEGDIYMVNYDLMQQLVTQGAAQSLDEYISSGLLNVEGLDLSDCTFEEPAPDEETPSSGVKHVYALPAVNMNRMLDSDINYDNRDKYLVLMQYSANPETSAYVMNLLMEELTAPLPEGLAGDETAAQDAPEGGESAAQTTTEEAAG